VNLLAWRPVNDPPAEAKIVMATFERPDGSRFVLCERFTPSFGWPTRQPLRRIAWAELPAACDWPAPEEPTL
jgi:hypothetical protein